MGIVGITVMVLIIIVIVKEVFDVHMEFLGGLIIGLLSGQIIPAWKYVFEKNQVNPNIIPYSQRKNFKAGIYQNDNRYSRGSVNIIFKSKYTGGLKNGYFVNEIIFPENNGINVFSSTLPYISKDFSSAKSYCFDTIELPSSKSGQLNGWKEFSFTWAWNIPSQDNMPIGEYKVKCMVFNENKELPKKTTEDSFEVINMTDNSQIGGSDIHMPISG